MNDPQPSCPITGTAFVVDDDGELGWGQADPEIHVAVELLNQLDGDDLGRAFLTAMYKLGDPCPHQPGTIHARRR